MLPQQLEKYNWLIGIGVVLLFLSIPAGILFLIKGDSTPENSSLNVLGDNSKLETNVPKPTIQKNLSYNFPLPAAPKLPSTSPSPTTHPSSSPTPLQTPTPTPSPTLQSNTDSGSSSNSKSTPTPSPTPTPTQSSTPSPSPLSSTTPSPSPISSPSPIP